MTRARSASRSANGPTPQNRSATVLAPSQCATTSRAKAASPAAVACRKAPGGRTTRGAAHPQRRRRALRDDLAVASEARQAAAFGDLRRASAHARGRQRPRSAHVDVEAGVGRRHLDVERLARSGQRLGDRPGRLDRAVEPGREDGAAVDRHHVMRPERGEADLEHVVCAAPRVEYGAPASLAVGVDEIVDRRVEPGLRQRLDDQLALPGAIARRGQCWSAQPPQIAEMRADRRDAVGARDVDLDRDARRSGWPGHGSTSTVSPGSV